MNRYLADIVGGAASVALTVYATRWCLAKEPGEAPKTTPAGKIYTIRMRIRVGSYLAMAFCIGCAVFAFRAGSYGIAAFFIAFGLLAAWFAEGGFFLIDETGITKKTLWSKRTLRWSELTKVVVHKRDSGAIELGAGDRKLTVDMRFVAPQDLLSEVQQHISVPMEILP